MAVEFITLADFKLKFKDKRFNPLLEQSQLDDASNHLCDIARGFEVEESDIALPLDNIAMDYLRYRTYFLVGLDNANNSPNRRPQNASQFNPDTSPESFKMKTYERQMNQQVIKLNAKIFRGTACKSVEFSGVVSLSNG